MRLVGIRAVGVQLQGEPTIPRPHRHVEGGPRAGPPLAVRKYRGSPQLRSSRPPSAAPYASAPRCPTASRAPDAPPTTLPQPTAARVLHGACRPIPKTRAARRPASVRAWYLRGPPGIQHRHAYLSRQWHAPRRSRRDAASHISAPNVDPGECQRSVGNAFRPAAVEVIVSAKTSLSNSGLLSRKGRQPSAAQWAGSGATRDRGLRDLWHGRRSDCVEAML